MTRILGLNMDVSFISLYLGDVHEGMCKGDIYLLKTDLFIHIVTYLQSMEKNVFHQ